MTRLKKTPKQRWQAHWDKALLEMADLPIEELDKEFELTDLLGNPILTPTGSVRTAPYEEFNIHEIQKDIDRLVEADRLMEPNRDISDRMYFPLAGDPGYEIRTEMRDLYREMVEVTRGIRTGGASGPARNRPVLPPANEDLYIQ